MTKKQMRLEREQYHYWQGQLDPKHPELQSLLPNLAHKFLKKQVRGRPNYGGLPKLVYWFMQGPEIEPIHPICLTVVPTVIRSSLCTTRTLSAIMMRAPWPVLVRSLEADHRRVIVNAQLLDTCPPEFHHSTHSRPKTWDSDLAHCRDLLTRMILNYRLKPIDLLRSIQRQAEHIRHRAKLESIFNSEQLDA
jgi:hypothetical protein